MLRVHRLPMKKTTIPCFLGGNNVTQCKITYHLQSANSFSHQINESLFIDLIGCVDAFFFVSCSVCVRTFACCLVEHKAKQSKQNRSSPYFSMKTLLEKTWLICCVKNLIFFKRLIFLSFVARQIYRSGTEHFIGCFV